MFSNKRKNELSEIYRNVPHTKTVRRRGAYVTFDFAPHPRFGSLIRNASIYVNGIGLVTFPHVVEGSLENGFPKTDWKKEADKVLIGAEAILKLKYDDSIVRIARQLIEAGKDFGAVEDYINGLIRVALVRHGVIIQTVGGYKAADMFQYMSPETKKQVEEASKNQMPPPSPPAAQPESPKTEDYRKKMN